MTAVDMQADRTQTEKQPLLANSRTVSSLSNGILPSKGEMSEDKQSMFVIGCILLTELCERMTFYSISANLVLFCTNELDFSSPDATTVQYVFTGTCYLLPVIGGWIADTISGMFNAIYGCCLLYIVGAFLLVCSAIDYRNWFGRDDEGRYYNLNLDARTAYYMTGLFFIAMGTGGIKANVGPYGALQAEQIGPKAVQTFFQWFYFFINVGSFIAYSAVAYVQQNIDFSYGYLIPLISMVLSLAILMVGRSKYKNNSPAGSVLSTAGKAIVESFRRRGETNAESFLDNAKNSYGGSFPDSTVEGIKSLGRVIPVFAPVVMYWAVSSQMSSTYFLQSVRMDVRIGSLVTPAAALHLFNIVTILILIPFMDRLVYPCLARWGKHPTLLQRMGFGMILIALSVIYAGVLEIFRKQNLAETGGFIQVIGGTAYNSSTLSMFLQIPQFALIGASEVFTSATGLEFAYSQSPQIMQGLIMGLFLLTSGLGNYVSLAIVQIVQAATVSRPWFPNEINNGYTEYLYFLLGGLMVLDFLAFVVIAQFYKYREVEKGFSDVEILKETLEKKTGMLPAHENPAFTNPEPSINDKSENTSL